MGSVQKRKTKGGKFYFTAKVRRRGHPQLFATFQRLTDARAWVDQQEVKIRQGIHIDHVEARKHTLSEAIEKYLQTKPPRSRVFHLKRWNEELGSLLLGNINKIQINEVMSRWRVKFKHSNSTSNHYLIALSLTFKNAKELGWTSKNPVPEAKRYKLPKGVVRYLTDEERESLLKACKQDEYKPIYLIVVLALSTGMRKEELLSLTWPQIDLEHCFLLLTDTKNGEPRRVSLKGLALDLLKEHSKVRHINNPFLFPAKKESPYKICNRVPVSERHFDIRKPWERVLKKANITNFRFHDLRHSCASYLAMNGASLLEIAEVLGHKSVDIVPRYAHLSPNHTASVVEKMNRKIFG